MVDGDFFYKASLAVVFFVLLVLYLESAGHISFDAQDDPELFVEATMGGEPFYLPIDESLLTEDEIREGLEAGVYVTKGDIDE